MPLLCCGTSKKRKKLPKEIQKSQMNNSTTETLPGQHKIHHSSTKAVINVPQASTVPIRPNSPAKAVSYTIPDYTSVSTFKPIKPQRTSSESSSNSNKLETFSSSQPPELMWKQNSDKQNIEILHFSGPVVKNKDHQSLAGNGNNIGAQQLLTNRVKPSQSTLEHKEPDPTISPVSTLLSPALRNPPLQEIVQHIDGSTLPKTVSSSYYEKPTQQETNITQQIDDDFDKIISDLNNNASTLPSLCSTFPRHHSSALSESSTRSHILSTSTSSSKSLSLRKSPDIFNEKTDESSGVASGGTTSSVTASLMAVDITSDKNTLSHQTCEINHSHVEPMVQVIDPSSKDSTKSTNSADFNSTHNKLHNFASIKHDGGMDDVFTDSDVEYCGTPRAVRRRVSNMDGNPVLDISSDSISLNSFTEGGISVSEQLKSLRVGILTATSTLLDFVGSTWKKQDYSLSVFTTVEFYCTSLKFSIQNLEEFGRLLVESATLNPQTDALDAKVSMQLLVLQEVQTGIESYLASLNEMLLQITNSSREDANVKLVNVVLLTKAIPQIVRNFAQTFNEFVKLKKPQQINRHVADNLTEAQPMTNNIQHRIEVSVQREELEPKKKKVPTATLR